MWWTEYRATLDKEDRRLSDIKRTHIKIADIVILLLLSMVILSLGLKHT